MGNAIKQRIINACAKTMSKIMGIEVVPNKSSMEFASKSDSAWGTFLKTNEENRWGSKRKQRIPTTPEKIHPANMDILRNNVFNFISSSLSAPAILRTIETEAANIPTKRKTGKENFMLSHSLVLLECYI